MLNAWENTSYPPSMVQFSTSSLISLFVLVILDEPIA